MSRGGYRAHGRTLPDEPPPSTMTVELTFQRQRVEHWIRFGRKSYECIIDRIRAEYQAAMQLAAMLEANPSGQLGHAALNDEDALERSGLL